MTDGLTAVRARAAGCTGAWDVDRTVGEALRVAFHEVSRSYGGGGGAPDLYAVIPTVLMSMHHEGGAGCRHHFARTERRPKPWQGELATPTSAWNPPPYYQTAPPVSSRVLPVCLCLRRRRVWTPSLPAAGRAPCTCRGGGRAPGARWRSCRPWPASTPSRGAAPPPPTTSRACCCCARSDPRVRPSHPAPLRVS
jgi:hypothetical protein